MWSGSASRSSVADLETSQRPLSASGRVAAQPQGLPEGTEMIAVYRRIDELETRVEEQNREIQSLLERVAALESEAASRTGGRGLALVPNPASAVGDRLTLEGARRPGRKPAWGAAQTAGIEQALVRPQWGRPPNSLLSPSAAPAASVVSAAPSVSATLGSSGSGLGGSHGSRESRGGLEASRTSVTTPGYDVSAATVYSRLPGSEVAGAAGSRTGSLRNSTGSASGRPKYPKEGRYSEMPGDRDQLWSSLARDREASVVTSGSMVSLTSTPPDPRRAPKPAVPWGMQGPHFAERQGASLQSVTAPRTEHGRMVERIKLV